MWRPPTCTKPTQKKKQNHNKKQIQLAIIASKYYINTISYLQHYCLIYTLLLLQQTFYINTTNIIVVIGIIATIATISTIINVIILKCHCCCCHLNDLTTQYLGFVDQNHYDILSLLCCYMLVLDVIAVYDVVIDHYH